LRAYESDGEAEAYTGAAQINDTPKDERISLTLSDAFDIFAKTRVVGYKKLGKHTTSRTYAVVVHNEKKTDETVRITDGFEERSTITTTSIPDRKLSAGNFEWDVPVKAGAQTTFTFTVQSGR
jgi:hypothetical protein